MGTTLTISLLAPVLADPAERNLVQERLMLYSGRLPVGRRHWNYPHWTDPMDLCSMVLMLAIVAGYFSLFCGGCEWGQL